jgi:hypothetical protein
MSKFDLVEAFGAEIDDVLVDRYLFLHESSEGIHPRAPIQHEVNGIEYYKTFNAGVVTVQGLRYAIGDKRVDISTPLQDEEQDHLKREVAFGGVHHRWQMTVADILLPTDEVESEIRTLKELKTALFIARNPHKSTPARLALAQLTEAEQEIYDAWAQERAERVEERQREVRERMTMRGGVRLSRLDPRRIG